MIIVVVVVLAYSISYNSSLPPVVLPNYLNQCISLTEPPVYVSLPTIQIFVRGRAFPIPANIGVSGPVGSCIRPINTRANTGLIHINALENRDYTVRDFFLVWGATYGPTYAIFSRSQIFTYKADADHNITMTVNGYPDPYPAYEDTPFPHNANDTAGIPFNIIISYG